jgi:hypothetical protein
MSKLSKTLITAAILAASGIAAAATPLPPANLQVHLPVCSSGERLVITAKTDKVGQAVAEQLAKLKQPACAVAGPHTGAWLIDGTQKAMQVGVIPYGDASGLLIASPEYTVLAPLAVRVETKQ